VRFHAVAHSATHRHDEMHQMRCERMFIPLNLCMYITYLCFAVNCSVFPFIMHHSFKTRDRPKLIFINSVETEMGPKYSNVVSAKNELRPNLTYYLRPKPKPKINNAECITYVSATINMHREFGEVRRMVTEQW